MNMYMEMQIRNMQVSLKAFIQSCEMAAKADDGSIDRKEQKQLDKIKAAADKFSKELSAIK